MIGKFVTAASQVLFVALIVGAGLPAIFAVGVRALAAGAGPEDAHEHGATASPGNRLSTVFGYCCFAMVLAAVALAITIIVASGFGKTVSFEHLLPVLVDKK